MLFSSNLRTPSQRSEIDRDNFSFVDGFPDQKQQKTRGKSSTKNSDFETTSCCTCGVGTDYQKDEEEQFFQQNQVQTKESNRRQNLSYGINVSKHIIYSSPEQYQEKLQNLLSQKNIDQQNKVYIRMIILEKQIENDFRLKGYFQWAIDQYRVLKQGFFQQKFNSALSCN